jgi:glyoxylase-like metal-dependent hydrolase (beta-lactamase superfamily II)
MGGGLMRPLRLSRSVWRLGSYHAAVYLLAGQDQAAIFEVGLAASAPVVLAQLDALGIERQEVRHLIISHAHADHASGQAALRAGLPLAVLGLTPGSRAFLQKPSTARRFAADDLYTSGQVARRDGLEGPCPASLPLLPPPLQDIQDGDVMDLGGLEARFLAAPGHVPDGLICHLPGEGLVLAADSAGFCTKGRPGFPLHFVSYPQYMASLAAITALEPVALGLGHQDCFLGAAARQYLLQTREHLESEHRSILQALAGGQDPEAVAQGFCQRYYRDELTVYPAESILNCARLLVRRSMEASANTP